MNMFVIKIFRKVSSGYNFLVYGLETVSTVKGLKRILERRIEKEISLSCFCLI